MEYKISKEAMRLIDNVAEEAFTDGVARALDPSDDYEKTRDELETYVAKLESNLLYKDFEILSLKERLSWKSTDTDELPELDQDVVVRGEDWTARGHFFNFEDGNDCEPDIRFSSHDSGFHFDLDELSSTHWRYV